VLNHSDVEVMALRFAEGLICEDGSALNIGFCHFLDFAWRLIVGEVVAGCLAWFELLFTLK
jgi:hypothetical protein